MTWILTTLLIAIAATALGLAWCILRFHASLGQHHLRGRYTWADEIAAQEQPDNPANDAQ
ncbi:hypothetical protein QWZ03_03520 [Chitinimonas viridis]|uniref:Uncharacterized protein n=1 Tax=Chitinimonas viridis TaxID=664880 RepID=A0ABT8B1A9_9NEIS|nr:hypothetical protein [Chitinimonas viridis]MDN3575839.1 hypothetical protein [Chitinimonas viridis]